MEEPIETAPPPATLIFIAVGSEKPPAASLVHKTKITRLVFAPVGAAPILQVLPQSAVKTCDI
jgi:hypothetical protein